MLAGAYEFFLRVIYIHLIILAIDFWLKSWLHSRYTSLKVRTGISVGLFYVQWYTKVFNRCILRFGSRRSKFQKKWFMFGTWVSLAILPLAIYFILQSMFAMGMNLLLKKVANYNQPVGQLTPYLDATIIGVNLPISDIFYYVISLFTCVVVHEFGHAFAAVREGLTITGFGVSIVFIFPVAFVRIEGLENLTPTKRLQVVCAGIWHNVVLAVFASIILLALPLLSYPLYDYRTGIQIVAMSENSPLQGTGGLKFGDVITNVNDCPVVDLDSWIGCIQQVAKSPAPGYCLTADFIHENDETVRVRQQSNMIECCHNETASGLCFEYLERSDNPLELPQYSCLRVRSVVEHSQSFCQSSDECGDLHCFRPSISEKMKLFVFVRKNSDEALFLGLPVEVRNHLSVSEYISTTIFSAVIPNCVYKFLNFVIMFSGALAAVNLVPCFHFDGQSIVDNLVFLYLRRNVNFSEQRNACFVLMSAASHQTISYAVTSLGTIILVVYTMLAFVTAFMT